MGKLHAQNEVYNITIYILDGGGSNPYQLLMKQLPLYFWYSKVESRPRDQLVHDSVGRTKHLVLRTLITACTDPLKVHGITRIQHRTLQPTLTLITACTEPLKVYGITGTPSYRTLQPMLPLI